MYINYDIPKLENYGNKFSKIKRVIFEDAYRDRVRVYAFIRINLRVMSVLVVLCNLKNIYILPSQEETRMPKSELPCRWLAIYKRNIRRLWFGIGDFDPTWAKFRWEKKTAD